MSRLWLGLSLLVTSAATAADTEVADVLALPEAPPGVVFELATGDEAALEWAVPQMNRHVAALRARYPGLPIALVTHGREQFALQADRAGQHAQLHDRVKALVQADVPVHVCETYALMRGVAAEDFAGFVDVAPAGPAQLNAYRELGYVHLRLRRPR